MRRLPTASILAIASVVLLDTLLAEWLMRIQGWPLYLAVMAVAFGMLSLVLALLIFVLHKTPADMRAGVLSEFDVEVRTLWAQTIALLKTSD